MSVVAVKVYNNHILIASDSITVRGWTQDKKGAKLVRIKDLILGSVGLAEESGLLQVYLATREPEAATEAAILNMMSDFAEWKNKKIGKASIENSYILLCDGKAFTIEGFFVSEVTHFMAIGAGMDFALAALHLGRNPYDAVETACELSIYCEQPVVSFEVRR